MYRAAHAIQMNTPISTQSGSVFIIGSPIFGKLRRFKSPLTQPTGPLLFRPFHLSSTPQSGRIPGHEHAAVAKERLQALAAAFAVGEELASVGRHDPGSSVTALGTRIVEVRIIYLQARGSTE
jgi:hypothetical protein